MISLEAFEKLGIGSSAERIKKLKDFIAEKPDNLYELLDLIREVNQPDIETRIKLEMQAKKSV